MLITLLFLSFIIQCLSTPAGFTTFFNSAACPDGWQELPTARGRLILSVSDASFAGVTVNSPLTDQEDRMHIHSYSTIFPLSEKDIAAISCCNNQGACHGNYPVAGEMINSTTGLPFVQLVLCSLQSTTLDPVPFGTVAFFEPSVSQCPPEFSPFDEGSGRFMIPGYTDKGVIPSDAKPLVSGEDRKHLHSFSTSITTTDVSYAGVDGCCNDGPAASGTYAVSGSTSDESSGLPYLQLLTCVSQQQTFDSKFPSSTLLFNEIACPPGWNVSLASAGRFVVALPENATPGATFGGRSLKPGYSGDIPHSHSYEGTVRTKSCGVGLASGCCGDGYAADSTYSYHGTSSTDGFSVSYLSTPMCVQ